MLQMRYSYYYDSKTAQSRLKKLNRYPEYSLIPQEIVCQATLTGWLIRKKLENTMRVINSSVSVLETTNVYWPLREKTIFLTFQPAPTMHFNKSRINVHYHYLINWN